MDVEDYAMTGPENSPPPGNTFEYTDRFAVVLIGDQHARLTLENAQMAIALVAQQKLMHWRSARLIPKVSCFAPPCRLVFTTEVIATKAIATKICIL